MTINTLFAVDVVKVRAFPIPNHEIHPDARKQIHLARNEIASRQFKCALLAIGHERLLRGQHNPPNRAGTKSKFPILEEAAARVESLGMPPRDGQFRFLLRAAEFAARKHREQRRKDSDASPYINHPVTVARLLADIGGIDEVEVLAAALLHDTIEDTRTTAAELEAEFGPRVRALVEAVTDDTSLPRDERKQFQVEHAAQLDPDAVAIKLADKIANVRDMAQHPPANWDSARRVEYLDWAEAVVANCRNCNEPLLNTFREAVKAGRVEIP